MEVGRFVLTGSQHFGLVEKVSQSLAGRTAVLVLLPFSADELQRGDWLASQLNQVLWTGAYPPQRGALFESWVFSELTKALANKGEPAGIYFWRTHGGQEVDFLLERSGTMLAIEAKAGMTVDPGAVRTLESADNACANLHQHRIQNRMFGYPLMHAG